MNKVRYGFGVTAAAFACAIAGVGVSANAQTPAAPPPAPFPGSEPIVAFGQDMAAKGVFFQLSYDEQITGLAGGGAKQAIMPVGNGSAGVIFDFQTMFGLTGSSFHINFNQRSGLGIGPGVPQGGDAGTSMYLQYDHEGLAFNMSQFYWEQGFDNDRIDILIGRTQPTFDFMFSDISCVAIFDMLCAQPGSFYSMQGSSPYGYSQWGGRINLQLYPQVYLRAGIYDEDGTVNANFHSNGFTWSSTHSVGVLIPFELGYQTNFSSAQYPAKYDVGFYVDTSAYNNITLSTAGYVNTGTVNRDRTAIWAQLEQTVWRPDRATNQSLTAFAQMITYSGGGNFYGQYTAGLYDRAPFGAARPLDTITFEATWYRDNYGYLLQGGGASAAYQLSAPHRNPFGVELNYGFNIIPGFTITPYVQLVVDPDNPGGYTNSAGSTTLKNDWLLGVQLSLDLAGLFHFPVWAPH